ncbi:MAG TPA: hypothetical protein VMG60_11055 [Burkholderiaceae bacterium]|nr:hypothetical protein [Burkholderiaceae bacterium]
METFSIFLASSKELEEDRRSFEIFINRKNKEWVEQVGIFLRLELWEDFLDAFSRTRLQDEYDKRIRKCDLFLMLFFTKVGPYTEEEFETAVGQFKSTNKPFVFTYFKDALISSGEIDSDTISLVAFKKKLRALGHFPGEYKNIEDLQLQFSGQLQKLYEEGFFAPAGASGAARPAGGTPILASSDRTFEAAVKLLRDALLGGPDADDRARRLVDQISARSCTRHDSLFDVVRYFIEYRLLNAKEAELESPELAPDAELEKLVSRLTEVASVGSERAASIDVLSDFFARTDDREERWKAYFTAVAKFGDAGREALSSISRIHVRTGFIAPQYLLAGLLSRFDYDWRKVLNSYQRAIPSPAKRNGAFESLQSSQWMCWLMWGPSVPLCTCRRWRGLVAYQYGYGDENNSLPLLEVPSDGSSASPALDALGSALCAERRGSRFAEVTGRLRWAPWFLRKESEPDADQGFDLASQDKVDDPGHAAQLGAAAAQAALYNEAFHPNLVLQLEKIDSTNAETRVYYSAYLWLIFLVAVPPRRPQFKAAGLSLLRGKECPDWPTNEQERRRLREAHLWEHLLPVFVHANIGDPAALALQKQMLVEEALRMLHEVWERRQELFDPDDVAAGIRFHLACASDYSGCGRPLRFAPRDPLLTTLRKRQAAEPDRAFAEAIVLPQQDETEESRPWALRGYFSACDLVEVIGDYFDDVAPKI